MSRTRHSNQNNTMNHTLRVALVVASLTYVSVASADVIVDLDASFHSPVSPVAVTLGPGDYLLTPIDRSAGGQFVAWHPWGGTGNLFCESTGLCKRGWIHSYAYRSDEHLEREVSGERFYVSPEMALENAVVEQIRLQTERVVYFYLPDDPAFLFDNDGGVSLRIDVATSTPVLNQGWGSIKALW